MKVSFNEQAGSDRGARSLRRGRCNFEVPRNEHFTGGRSPRNPFASPEGARSAGRAAPSSTESKHETLLHLIGTVPHLLREGAKTRREMPRFDKFLAYAESHRLVVCAFAAVLLCGVGWLDWTLPSISVGFLYLIPVLLCAAALNGTQIVALAIVCAYLREAFDPLQSFSESTGSHCR